MKNKIYKNLFSLLLTFTLSVNIMGISVRSEETLTKDLRNGFASEITTIKQTGLSASDQWISNETIAKKGIMLKNANEIDINYNKTFLANADIVPYAIVNDSFINAEAILVNEYKNVSVTSANQKLYYSFTPKTTGFYAIESSSATGDPQGWLYSSQKVQLALNDDGAGSLNYRIVSHLNANQKYFIAAGCYGSGTGNYKLRVTSIVNLNDGISTIPTDKVLRTPSAMPITTAYSVNISTSYQKQYFSFTAPTTGNYVFQSFEKDSTSDPYGWLYDSSGGLLINDDDGAGNRNFSISYSLTAGQKVYIVTGCYSDWVGNYTIRVISGINRFYSEYFRSKFNDVNSNPETGVTTNKSHIQTRMNCYGYVFGNIFKGLGDYKQQPGDFCIAEDKTNVKRNIIGYDPVASMANVVNNIKLDAKRLGYTITEYSTANSTVEQFGTTSRLIAVVTGNTDYHFYMQHNDGTWSHKRGLTPVTNKSIDNSAVVLTNSNIKARANEGGYVNGSLKFFLITKDAVIDYPHESRCCDTKPCAHTSQQINLSYTDKAGEYIATSSIISTGTTAARMDFAEDHDLFYFIAPSTKTYTIITTSSSESDLDCIIYDRFGNRIYSSIKGGPVNIMCNMVSDEIYYIQIYDYNKTQINYSLTIS